MLPHNACSHWKWMTGVWFYVISSVSYYIISVEMAVLAATLTAQLFEPALTSSFHALCFIFSSAWTSSSAVIFWHLFVVLEWCKTAAHSRCWIRLSLGLNPSPSGLFHTAHMSSKAAQLQAGSCCTFILTVFLQRWGSVQNTKLFLTCYVYYFPL